MSFDPQKFDPPQFGYNSQSPYQASGSPRSNSGSSNSIILWVIFGIVGFVVLLGCGGVMLVGLVGLRLATPTPQGDINRNVSPFNDNFDRNFADTIAKENQARMEEMRARQEEMKARNEEMIRNMQEQLKRDQEQLFNGNPPLPPGPPPGYPGAPPSGPPF